MFLDIETTGASPRSSRVLEVGAARVENGKIVRTYNQLIDPEEHVPSFITNLTGIKDEDVWGKPTFRAITQELDELLDGAIFVAHNVTFDYNFLAMEYTKLRAKFAKDRLCTVRLSRALYPHEKSHRLDAIIERHGYEVTNRHRAYDDAEILYKFFTDSYEKFGLDIFRHMDRLITYAKM